MVIVLESGSGIGYMTGGAYNNNNDDDNKRDMFWIKKHQI